MLGLVGMQPGETALRVTAAAHAGLTISGRNRPRNRSLARIPSSRPLPVSILQIGTSCALSGHVRAIIQLHCIAKVRAGDGQVHERHLGGREQLDEAYRGPRPRAGPTASVSRGLRRSGARRRGAARDGRRGCAGLHERCERARAGADGAVDDEPRTGAAEHTSSASSSRRAVSSSASMCCAVSVIGERRRTPLRSAASRRVTQSTASRSSRMRLDSCSAATARCSLATTAALSSAICGVS